MRPKTIGRAFGIGVRVAGRVAGQRLAAQAQSGAQIPSPQAVPSAPPIHRQAGRAGRGLARGVGGFLRPFAKVGRALWLEVAGVFFLLPVLTFGSYMWRIRASWNHGPDHRVFLASAVIVVVFIYLSITSFWRASRK